MNLKLKSILVEGLWKVLILDQDRKSNKLIFFSENENFNEAMRDAQLHLKDLKEQKGNRTESVYSGYF